MTITATGDTRDFDNCAHVTRSGKRCGALRWYHNDHARHKFVEPKRIQTDAERVVKLEKAIKSALDKVFNDGKREGWVEIQQSAIDELRAVLNREGRE